MEKFKIQCTHCGKQSTKKLSGFENQIQCPKCKNQMNTKFDFKNYTIILN